MYPIPVVRFEYKASHIGTQLLLNQTDVRIHLLIMLKLLKNYDNIITCNNNFIKIAFLLQFVYIEIACDTQLQSKGKDHSRQ